MNEAAANLVKRRGIGEVAVLMCLTCRILATRGIGVIANCILINSIYFDGPRTPVTYGIASCLEDYGSTFL